MTLSIWYRFFALNVALNRKCSACCSICISVGLWIVDFILWTKIKKSGEIKYVFSARRCYDFKFMDPHCFCFLFEIYKLQQYDSWTDSLRVLAMEKFVGTICAQNFLKSLLPSGKDLLASLIGFLGIHLIQKDLFPCNGSGGLGPY